MKNVCSMGLLFPFLVIQQCALGECMEASLILCWSVCVIQIAMRFVAKCFTR